MTEILLVRGRRRLRRRWSCSSSMSCGRRTRGRSPGTSSARRRREGPGPRGPPRPGQGLLRGPVAGRPQGQHGRVPQAGPGEPRRPGPSRREGPREEEAAHRPEPRSMKGDLHKMQDARVAVREGAGPQVRRAVRPAEDRGPGRRRELQDTANHLRQALVSTKARGQWGERMAEDVLRLAGFIEGVNYLKQKVLEAARLAPGLHLPAAPGPEGQHGRQVPAEQLPPLPRDARTTWSARPRRRSS